MKHGHSSLESEGKQRSSFGGCVTVEALQRRSTLWPRRFGRQSQTPAPCTHVHRLWTRSWRTLMRFKGPCSRSLWRMTRRIQGPHSWASVRVSGLSLPCQCASVVRSHGAARRWLVRSSCARASPRLLALGGGAGSVGGPSSSSLLKVLLRVEVLQPALLDRIVERIALVRTQMSTQRSPPHPPCAPLPRSSDGVHHITLVYCSRCQLALDDVSVSQLDVSRLLLREIRWLETVVCVSGQAPRDLRACHKSPWNATEQRRACEEK